MLQYPHRRAAFPSDPSRLRTGRLELVILTCHRDLAAPFGADHADCAVFQILLFVLTLRFWQLRQHWPTLDHYRWSAFCRVARDAFPFFSYNLTQVGYGKVAILCFGLVAPPEQVGWFAAAFVLSDVIPQWSYASSGALLPVWTRLFENGRVEEMVSLRQRLLDILLFASIPVWLSLALFAPEVCALLGSRYVASAPVLRIVACRSVLAVLDGFLGHGFLVAVNRLKERQVALSLSLVLLAALSTLFGYLWGAVGVAIGLFISDATLILQYLRITSRIGMQIEWPSVAPSFFAGAIMVIWALAIPQQIPFPLKLSTAFLAYLIALMLLSRDRVMGPGEPFKNAFAKSRRHELSTTSIVIRGDASVTCIGAGVPVPRRIFGCVCCRSRRPHRKSWSAIPRRCWPCEGALFFCGRTRSALRARPVC